MECNAFWCEKCHKYLFKTMIEIFGNYMDKFLNFFVGDFNIHNMTWKDNLNHFLFVLLKLKVMNLKLNLSKCEFAKTNIGFIGHVVSRDGTQPNQQKNKAIIEFPMLTIVTNVKAFFGLTKYY